MEASSAQEAQRYPHSFLERTIGKRFIAVLSRAARLVGAETEGSEAGNDIQLPRLLRRRGCFRARLGFLSRSGRTCFGSRAPSLFAFVAHEFNSERALSFILVVRSAPEPDPFHGRHTAECHRVRMIELQESARRATPTSWTDEGALTSIPPPYRSPHRGGDVSLPWLERARLGRGRLVAANRRRSSSRISVLSARAITASTSPGGIW